MRIPEKTELPIASTPRLLKFDQALHSRFALALESERKDLPPTAGAVALQGVFEILDAIEVDWKGLLHASQKFIYHKVIPIGTEVIAETNLRDARVRAGMLWLQFETRLLDQTTRVSFGDSFSLIMVKVPS